MISNKNKNSFISNMIINKSLSTESGADLSTVKNMDRNNSSTGDL